MSKNSLQKEPTALTPFMLHLILPTVHTGAGTLPAAALANVEWCNN